MENLEQKIKNLLQFKNLSLFYSISVYLKYLF